jgi:hypothetical protein
MATRSGLHPKRVGAVSQAKVLAALVAAGKSILLPFGENTRYDLLIEESGRFVRVQCKTGRLGPRGAIKFPTASTYGHHTRRQGCERRGYRGEADLFGVYCPENDRVYLVPVDSVPNTQGCLRITAPANGQRRQIRWAEEFELTQSYLLG